MDILFFFSKKKCLNYRAEKKLVLLLSSSRLLLNCLSGPLQHLQPISLWLPFFNFHIYIYIYIYIYSFFSVDFDQQRILVFQIWLYCEFCGIIVLVDEFCVNKICDFKAFSSPIKHMKIFSKCVTKNRKKILFSRK